MNYFPIFKAITNNRLINNTKNKNQKKSSIMKKIIFTLAAILLASFVCQTISAQDMSNREMRKKLRLRPPREVRQEARSLEKEGYKVAVGAPTIERQLVDAWLKQQETDENGNPKFFVGNATSVGETQIAAKLQATEAAKLDIAGQIESRVAALIENNIANAQLNMEEANSVTQTIAASKSMVAQRLSNLNTLVEMYRPIDKNMEASVSIAYNRQQAIDETKNVIRKSLEEKTDILQEELDKILDIN